MIVDSVQEERDVTFLVSPKAAFVSLVPRGANQIPFRIVKNQRGSDMSVKVLHKLIVPKDVDLEEVRKTFDEDTRDLLNLENGITTNKFRMFEQLPAEKCQKGSFELVTIDKKLGITGVQAEPVEAEGKGLIAKMLKKAAKPVIALDGAEVVSEEVMKGQYVEELYDEIWCLSDAVAAIVSQEMGDPEAKLSAIRSVIDNFLAFVENMFAVAKSDIIIPQRTEKDSGESGEGHDDNKQVVKQQTKEVVEQTKENEAPVKKSAVTDEPVNESVKKEDAKPQLSVDDVRGLLEEIVTPIKKSVSDLSESVSGLNDQVTQVKNSIPIVVNSVRENDVVSKSETPNGEDTFKGIFGRLG